MKPDPETARQFIQNAHQSLQRGDRQAARRWAEMAAAMAPELEEPWLILAGLASPRASISYLERALKINPDSERARKGMHWAVERLRDDEKKHPTPRQTQGRPPQAPGPLRTGADLSPAAVSEPPTRPRTGIAPHSSAPISLKSITKYRWSFLTLFVLAVCVTLAVAFWPGGASPAQALLGPQSTPSAPGAPAEVDKPTYTPTFTSTYTPTDTPTSTPTFTLTPTPTNTPSPTFTFTPSLTPLPTNTPFQPATEETYYSTSGVHWIDVDLSQQMLYAYEGDTIVASFLVSTGVSAFPTVVGQFHVYMKFEYTDMAGPGYYLPDVPYTMYFYRGYGIHGTYWHSNFGTPMSHGCVNMYTPDAQWLFYWAPMGTLVNVHY